MALTACPQLRCSRGWVPIFRSISSTKPVSSTMPATRPRWSMSCTSIRRASAVSSMLHKIPQPPNEPAERCQVGRRSRSRRLEEVCGGVPWRRDERRTNRRRDRFLEKGQKERRCCPPIHRHRRRYAELPSRGIFGLLLEEWSGVRGPYSVPAQGVDGGQRARGRGRCTRGGRVCEQIRVGQEDASKGV